MQTPEGARTRAPGSGPGPITPDGCAVDLYAAVPARGEPELIHASVPAHAAVLELGCGTGRISTPLARLGHRVVGVDESAEMLARCVGITTVRSGIQSLRLPERFPVVVLPSHLVNSSDVELRDAFLRTCREHVESSGMVLIQRHRRGWIAEAADSAHDDGTLRSSLRVLGRPAPGLLHGSMTYELGDSLWKHEFTARDLLDEDLPDVLAAADLRLDRILTDDGSWFVAVPTA
ncbi:class I SAM-dependent methyltransferase [Actinospica robiniae]|uniref:class I SAM-dependent methyltransferase n=1 Tax=Actinospica robiniae TaxID=304901 RepID=UPI000406DACB|nr:class I SAM-dependent methyltransferase [Actinospica robiniae]